MNRRAALVAKHEGYRKHLYKCTAGKLTIGYGLNISEGLSLEESELLLNYRLNKIDEKLAYILPCYSRLSAVRQDVLCDMVYNLGLPRFFGFKKMLQALNESDYQTASVEMLDSLWAKQVKGRANELSLLMKHGTDIIL